ncbi:MAG: hypothetical protein HY606_14180, partial [Planctomycetes bacterium]|nr:hypothetical protein [Planctomycetota bacterium]
QSIGVWNEWRIEGRSDWIVDRIEIFNNTCYFACQGTNKVIASIQIDDAVTNSKIVNNIISSSVLTGLKIWNSLQNENVDKFTSPENNNFVSHNMFYKNRVDGYTGENSIKDDPRFERISEKPGDKKADFMLQTSSPAIDAGEDSGLAKYNKSEQDIGCYEFGLPRWEAGLNRAK